MTFKANNASKGTEPKSTNRQNTERRFRRYHKARDRRQSAQRADSRFFQAVFALAGVASALAIGIAVMAITGGGPNMMALHGWTEPWLGALSRLEVLGLAFVAVIGGMFAWRIRRR